MFKTLSKKYNYFQQVMKNKLQHKKIYDIQYEVSLFVKYYNVKNTRNTDILFM